MYVCKSKGKAAKSLTQFEISDFLGTKRTIIFDLDNPTEARKAKKVLRPKGITKRRIKKRVQQKDPNNQTILKGNLQLTKIKPNSNIKSAKIKKNEALSSFDQTKKKFTTRNVWDMIKPVEDSKSSKVSKIVKLEIAEENLNPSGNLNKASPIKSNVQSESPLERNISKSVKKSNRQTFQKHSKNIQTLTNEIMDQVGSGGDLEVICPFCKNFITFDHEDLDEKDLISARLCDCGSLCRISILSSNPRIFKDLGIISVQDRKKIKKQDTYVQDEYGNSIQIFGILID